MGEEVTLFVEHDDAVEVSDKAHCSDCMPSATDVAHCGTCMPEGAAEVTDKAHCGTCF